MSWLTLKKAMRIPFQVPCGFLFFLNFSIAIELHGAFQSRIKRTDPCTRLQSNPITVQKVGKLGGGTGIRPGTCTSVVSIGAEREGFDVGSGLLVSKTSVPDSQDYQN